MKSWASRKDFAVHEEDTNFGRAGWKAVQTRTAGSTVESDCCCAPDTTGSGSLYSPWLLVRAYSSKYDFSRI